MWSSLKSRNREQTHNTMMSCSRLSRIMNAASEKGQYVMGRDSQNRVKYGDEVSDNFFRYPGPFVLWKCGSQFDVCMFGGWREQMWKRDSRPAKVMSSENNTQASFSPSPFQNTRRLGAKGTGLKFSLTQLSQPSLSLFSFLLPVVDQELLLKQQKTVLLRVHSLMWEYSTSLAADSISIKLVPLTKSTFIHCCSLFLLFSSTLTELLPWIESHYAAKRREEERDNNNNMGKRYIHWLSDGLFLHSFQLLIKKSAGREGGRFRNLLVSGTSMRDDKQRSGWREKMQSKEFVWLTVRLGIVSSENERRWWDDGSSDLYSCWCCLISCITATTCVSVHYVSYYHVLRGLGFWRIRQSVKREEKVDPDDEKHILVQTGWI